MNTNVSPDDRLFAHRGDGVAATAIAVLSGVILAFLVWLIYFRAANGTDGRDWVGMLPTANAIFNGTSACLLAAGYVAIRRGRRGVHVAFMLSALVFSGLFLVSYITYHAYHGDTKFTGEGFIRPAYFFILITHIVLSMGMLPLIFTTLFLAGRKRFAAHRRVARVTFPIWMYVSVTGVVIYFLLRAHSGT